MKKYVVLKVYKSILPSVVFQSDDATNATIYAAVMQKEDSNYNYVVATVNE